MSALRKHKKLRSCLRQRGLTLVELMVACTVGILIMLAISYLIMGSLQTRSELIKTSRQIESGRYAMDALRQEIQLAGFYGTYFPVGLVNWTLPDPCATELENLEFEAQPVIQVPAGIQGFAQNEETPACIRHRLAGTDILVVRRVITEGVEIDIDPPDNQIDVGIDAKTKNAFYLQVSHCDEPAAEPPFVLANTADMTAFSLHQLSPAGEPSSCASGYRSEIWRYATYLFYVSSCKDCRGEGDGIPTLMRVEISPTPMVRPIAEGIQDMQIEYGFDTNGDGTPDVFEAGPGAGSPRQQWQDAVAVKVFLLARNLESTPGYKDEKTYMMGSNGFVAGPFNDDIRRQVYVGTTMAHNIAERRLQ